MSVQFILGRSGTGKTAFCIKSIVDALVGPAANRPLILLVPEQATYQAERAILCDKRIAGYSSGTGPGLNVLSFDRLQFLLCGKNTASPALTRLGQQMIVQRILRDNSSKLKVFGSSAALPGLGGQMAETIAELHQYAKTPDDIDELLDRLQKEEDNKLAALKFTDIGLVFKEYLKFIEGRFIDPDIQLTSARGAVGVAEFVKGAKLWVDGFSGFNTGELAILAELLKVAAESKIALCLDASDIDLENPDTARLEAANLFYPTQRTYAELVEMVKKCKLELAEPIILEEQRRFSSCQQLAHIERNVFKLEPGKIAAADNIRIISAPNGRAEVRFVAEQILHLVREKDFRYRDIAVIASDIDYYQHYIRAYFDDYGVPFFIDRRRLLNQHPIVQLVCSALQVVTGGFSSSDIFSYLKTDLVPIENCDVDMLGNYCLAFGIAGGDWVSGRDWYFAGRDNEDFDEQYINQIRLKVSGPLLKLRDRLWPGGDMECMISPEKFTQVVFDFLEELRVCESITGWVEEAERTGAHGAADEHQQFYNKFVDVFDELVEAFGGQEMTCENYTAIISSAFSQLKLAFIPPRLDQVLVGSVERSRHPDLKAVFLIGATQKQFPSPVNYNSLLTDEDRMAAEALDFELAATAGRTLAERQYLSYIAFTRPSQFLFVTYPLADDKGSPAVRSQFVNNLESLFEDLNEEYITGEQNRIEKVGSQAELVDLLCRHLGRDALQFEASDNRLAKLLEGMCLDTQLSELGSDVRSAINYDNSAKLDKAVVAELFGKRIKSSATRLSDFAKCPYKHFARHVLELKKRQEFKLEPLDLGVFYHCVLDGLLKRLNSEKKDFATIQDKELLELLREQIQKILSEDSFISNFNRHSAHNAFIINSASENLEDCVLAIAQMVRTGCFSPMASEIGFGKLEHVTETLGEYEIALSDNRVLVLSGKIDRLDTANIEGEKVAIVFDYKKRRDKSFSWTKFYSGLDMQLPIYMMAVRHASNSKYKTQDAAGAFYIPVEVKVGEAKFSELAKKTASFDYKARGIFNGEFFKQLDGETCSGWSKFYNFCITKSEGEYGRYSDSGALKSGDFEKVLRFTERKIVELAEEIVSGKIDVNPYRLGTESPCSYCEYKSVCRFDWQINDYNFLESVGKPAALEKMENAESRDLRSKMKMTDKKLKRKRTLDF